MSNPTKSFIVNKLIRMQHCDPGGVVFTPQYFNLFIEVMEDFFAEAIGHSFAQIVTEDQTGLPAMKIEAKFKKPSRLGDMLEYTVTVIRLRDTNVQLQMMGRCESQTRCVAKLLIGYSSLTKVSLTKWPDNISDALKKYKC